MITQDYTAYKTSNEHDFARPKHPNYSQRTSFVICFMYKDFWTKMFMQSVIST